MIVEAAFIAGVQPPVGRRPPGATVGPDTQDLPILGDAYARAEERRPGARVLVRDRRRRRRGDLRGGLGQAVGRADGHARRPRSAKQRLRDGTAAGQRDAQRGRSGQPRVEQAGERRGHEADQRDLLLTQGAQHALGVKALVHDRRRGVDRRSAGGPTGRPRARGEGRTATARSGRGRVRRRSRAHSTGRSRRSARPAWARKWCRRCGLRPRWRRDRALPRSHPAAERSPAPFPAAPRAGGMLRGACRCTAAPSATRALSLAGERRSTGTATAPSSRQAWSAWANASPAGSVMATRCPERTPRAASSSAPRRAAARSSE